MQFGTIIKKLRRDRDITQEKLAEYLNISPQAVSRWENEAAMPDVSLIPILANLFDVTTDFLLGVDITNKEKAINSICENAEQTDGTFDNYKARIQILRDGLKQYPNSWKLKEKLAHYLFSSACKRNETEENKKALLTEVVSICEDVLENCTDEKIRHSLTQTLCFSYKKLGMNDKGCTLAKSLPNMYVTCDELLPDFLEDKEKLEAIKNNIMSHYQLMSRNILELTFIKDVFSGEQKIELLKKIIAIHDALLDAGDNDRRRIIWMNGRIADQYIYLNDVENTLLYLEKDAELTRQHLSRITCTPSMLMTEYYLDHYVRNYSVKEDIHDVKSYIEDFSDKKYDFIRDTDRFKAIISDMTDFLKQLEQLEKSDRRESDITD